MKFPPLQPEAELPRNQRGEIGRQHINLNLGSIASHCSGNEPALIPDVPSREDRRPDSRKRRKSSLNSVFTMLKKKVFNGRIAFDFPLTLQVKTLHNKFPKNYWMPNEKKKN